MNDILVSILVILLVVVIVVAIFVLTGRKEKELEAAIQQLAQRSSWKFEKVNLVQQSGFILRGEGWMLESLVSSTDRTSDAGSSPVSYSNKWTTDQVTSPGGLVLVGPKTPAIQFGLGELVLQKELHLMLGDQSDQATGLAEVFVGRTPFRDRYSVWAASQETAEKMLGFDLENALLNWKSKELPLLKFTASGVEILTRQGRIDTPKEVQAMVELGMAVLGR